MLGDGTLARKAERVIDRYYARVTHPTTWFVVVVCTVLGIGEWS